MLPDWSIFDFKAVSMFSLNNKRERGITEELSRVGITDAIQFWSAPNPYNSVAANHIRHSSMLTGNRIDINIKHQQMIRTAFDLGKRNGLFFESDIRFLKDLDKLGDMLAELPSNYDIALLDWVPRQRATPAEIRSVTNQSGHWHRFVDLRSCAAYALSRKGMFEYLNVLEAPAKSDKYICKLCDQHWWDVLKNNSVNGYCACPNLCVQSVPGGASSYSLMWGQYSKINVRKEDYA